MEREITFEKKNRRSSTHARGKILIAAFASLCLTLTVACGKRGAQERSKDAVPGASPAAEQGQSAQPVDSSLLERIRRERWTGDLDGMRERRYIRALVTYNKTYYFYDGAEARGVSVEALREFEKVLNQKLQSGEQPVQVVFVPVRREELVPGLADGRGDIAASNIAITPERQKLVAFSDPVRDNARELIVTGPASPPLASLNDLGGKEVYVRKSSRYFEALTRLNAEFRKAGKPGAIIKSAEESLEDEDILEMVSAGLVGITAVDDLTAELWGKVLNGLRVHNDLVIADHDQIAWAFPKKSPQLAAMVNDFIKEHKVGTSFGNTLLRTYLADPKWIKNSTATDELKNFQVTVEFFKKYGTQYGFDWLMLAAQGYQESRLDQSVKSSAGAVGVMQIKPSTAAGNPININDVNKTEDNIHAGVKYLRFMIDQYFKDAKMDRVNRGLFAFASYNAGPNKIAKLRKQAAAEGLNPDRWFNNVELVAAREIGPETVTYVSNIYKYYVAYKLVTEHSAAKQDSVKSARVK
jgi:membrane-bound lytic murein transglycosylase MltF